MFDFSRFGKPSAHICTRSFKLPELLVNQAREDTLTESL